MARVISFPRDGRRETVLIVDDAPAIRGFLCDHLNECGFHCLCVASGEEAVTLFEQGTVIDLVFSDVQTAGSLTGFGLARWMQQHRPTVPVLLASGDLGKAQPQEELWGAEIMPKPYDFDSVVRRIGLAISGKLRRSA
ncbi:MAG TPA: response regulator [Rhizomicrobium sp.]|nr:response regulator [Rhizomicrobium sp.]